MSRMKLSQHWIHVLCLCARSCRDLGMACLELLSFSWSGCTVSS